MNIAFSKVLKISTERNLEFNFRKLPADYNSYHVDVTDEKGQRIMFSFYKAADGNWRSRGQRIPLWISDLDKMLGEVIEGEEVGI